jgi:hypothetical protein
VWWRESPSANDQWADVGLAVLSGFVGAAKEVRKELVGAGNPECKAFVFRLTKDGKSSLDVEY